MGFKLQKFMFALRQGRLATMPIGSLSDRCSDVGIGAGWRQGWLTTAMTNVR